MAALDELEFLREMVTGALAEPVAGLAGLGELALTFDPAAAAQRVESTRSALTMEGGEDSELREGLGTALAPLGEMFGALSEGYDENIGQPLTEQFGAPGAAIGALGKGIGAIAPIPGATAASKALQSAARMPDLKPLSTENYGPVRQQAAQGQAVLEQIGAHLEEINPEITYFNPPKLGGVDSTKLGRPAGVARAARKAAERGETVGDLTDLVRGSFEVPNPQIADEIVEMLRGRNMGDVIDEGWTGRPEAGYIDRPLKINTPDGLAYEVQLHVPGMMEAKFGPGHDIYESIRQTSDPGVLAQLNEQSRNVYQQVYDQLPQGWEGVLSGIQ
jgi:hypothetical protein